LMNQATPIATIARSSISWSFTDTSMRAILDPWSRPRMWPSRLSAHVCNRHLQYAH
jgi:hypothetical protein